MIILKPTTDSLELVTENLTSIDYSVVWADHSSSSVILSRSLGTVASITTASLVTAPSAGTTRQIRGVTLVNTTSGSASTIKIQIDNTSTETVLSKINLQPGDSFNYSDGTGWYSTDASGKLREQNLDNSENPGVGYMSPFYKFTSELPAQSQLRLTSLDAGTPGKWSVGTPGLSGRVVDGTAAADSGSLYLRSSGSAPYSYLRGFTASAAGAGGLFLVDILWVNSGIVTTTTTAQTITSVDWPLRDINGLTNGDGVEIGLLFTVSAANPSVTNTTLNYTGSNGSTNLTARITSVAGSSVIGTVYPFELATGSAGVRKIQSITLGTSYVTANCISLIAFRRISLVANPASHLAQQAPISDDGIRLWPGTSLHLMRLQGSGTPTIQGHVFIVEK